MAEYQIVETLPGMMQTVQRRADQAFIPFDPANRDYQEYLTWLDEGNVPDPPDPPPEPPPPEPVKLPAVMPTEPTDAVPKAYVDTELAKLVAGEITPLGERVTALEGR